MSSRPKYVLCGVGALLVLLLVLAVLGAPPDGVERGETRQFVGRFHPLAVHLPIALVLLVAVLELAGLARSGRHLQQAAGFVLALAAASSLGAVFLGWMLGRSGGYEGALVTRHMWGGISLAAALLLCCVIRGSEQRLYGAVLFLTVCLMAWTSDQGGKLTHGEGFLTEHMPGKLRAMLGVAAPAKRKAAANPAGTSTDLRAATVSAPAPAAVAFFASRVAPIFDDKCVQCHGPEKRKAKLRLDSFDSVMRGGKHGVVVKPGDPQGSELLRRVSLPRDNEDAMPAEGKPGLTAAELKVIEFWITSGAAETLTAEKVSLAPPPTAEPVLPPLAADYRPRAARIAALEAQLGVRLVPRSQNPRDGMILRTVSAPERCDDQVLDALQPVADLIVDAELARTRITDAGLKTLASFRNLRSLDLSHTAISSGGLAPLTRLSKLESLNLTSTDVDDESVRLFRGKPGLRHLYLFGTKSSEGQAAPPNLAKN
jgi:uncharacterized membrane protein